MNGTGHDVPHGVNIAGVNEFSWACATRLEPVLVSNSDELNKALANMASLKKVNCPRANRIILGEGDFTLEKPFLASMEYFILEGQGPRGTILRV